jgi:hypothetical protein
MPSVVRVLGIFFLLISATTVFVLLSPGPSQHAFSALLQGDGASASSSTNQGSTALGVPSSWVSTNDLAVSPLLHGNREAAKVYGGGLAQNPSISKDESESSQSDTPKVPVDSVKPSVDQKFMSTPSQKLVETPGKVQDLHREGLEQVHIAIC